MPTTQHGEIRLGEPSIPEVIVELVSLVTNDDWARYSTADDGRCYYVVGHQAAEADRQGLERFPMLSLPLPVQITPKGEATVHARVAAPKPSFVKRARRRLSAAGVDQEHVALLLDALEGKQVDASQLAGKFAFEKGSEQWRAFGDLLSAVVFERGLEVEAQSEAEDRLHASVATQKHYAQEFAQLFPNVVQRAGSLEELEAVDPQLNEASRCFLYGFFKATVLLSAGALEGCLRKIAGDEDPSPKQDSRGMYRRLVERAAAKRALGAGPTEGQQHVFSEFALEVFKRRNEVAHEGREPSRTVALEVLTKSRQIVDLVLSQANQQP